MDMQLVMLGTGHAMVTKCYNTCFAFRNDNEYLMVDAGGGNGIMAQLEKAEIPYTNIHNMIVTHGHTDHVLGVIWMVRKIATLISNNKYTGEFTIYCHDELVKTITTFCELTLPGKLFNLIGNGITIREVVNGEQIKIMGIDVQFFDIASKKQKQFGFSTTLPNGKKLACLGDEPYNESNKIYVENCDWMLSEAYCLYSDKDIFKPYEKYHSTALDAGKLAEQLNIKNLLLYHTEDSNLIERKMRYTNEAKTVFSGNVFVPNDLEKIQL
ncbi:MBL fold metallo-hydrolase [Clostridium sp. SHJSY1]|uniref:MBL fold metallo-hydrolase n=1 Tax=Clostridium sp. SHJSY1 TaxID=2942483 RepID=UPI0028768844|nr:MBL fold metallo-hydrolase [Clostridium sp. SHJSY1]MDS0527053.1 MBL fold metallo-hydrolase [Clostridium sp. SHJSY1]